MPSFCGLLGLYPLGKFFTSQEGGIQSCEQETAKRVWTYSTSTFSPPATRLTCLIFLESLNSITSQGYVRESGVICPLFTLIFGFTGINIRKMWVFPGNLAACSSFFTHGTNRKGRCLYWQTSVHLDGQISLNSIIHPCQHSCHPFLSPPVHFH